MTADRLTPRLVLSALALLCATGCGHMQVGRMPEELDHMGRLAVNVNAVAVPSLKHPALTIEGDGHSDLKGAEPISGGALIGLSNSDDRSAVKEIPFAIDPRLIVRSRQCISFGCVAVELSGLPHGFGIPLVGAWYGAVGNLGVLLTVARSGYIGAHLRVDAMGAYDHANWFSDNWTAATFSPSASLGVTTRVSSVVIGLDATVSRYLGSRTRGTGTPPVETTDHLAENQLLIGLSVGFDNE